MFGVFVLGYQLWVFMVPIAIGIASHSCTVNLLATFIKA